MNVCICQTNLKCPTSFTNASESIFVRLDEVTIHPFEHLTCPSMYLFVHFKYKGHLLLFIGMVLNDRYNLKVNKLFKEIMCRMLRDLVKEI